MCKSGGDGGAAEAQRAREAARQQNIDTGAANITSAFSAFDDDFFSNREKSFLDFALPQLDDQFGDAKNELILSLARNGRLQSSARGSKVADLEKKYNLQRQAILDEALGFANNARSDISTRKANLFSQNTAIADPSQIGSLAASAAGALSSSPSFTPLGTLFQNVTAGLSTQADLERRGQATFNTGLFSTRGNGSSSVIGK
ncbi:MAG: hypothetical protein JKY94_00930 [Rhodobacteraceae bacterium]|nr:hypothetical protein [Paracoccaceae bacterium]